MSSATPRWLTPPAIAAQLGMDVHRVLAAIRRGDLQAVDLREPGSSRPRYRVSPEALDKYLAARMVQAPPARARRQQRKRRPADLPRYV